jgi:hypothetical protein
MAERMPALFIGHGNPMNALLVNPYTQRWAAIRGTDPLRSTLERLPELITTSHQLRLGRGFSNGHDA